MKKLLLPFLALLCCASGAMAQQTVSNADRDKKIAAMENAKNAAIKSVNDQYQAESEKIKKQAQNSIDRIDEQIETLNKTQALTSTTSNRTGNSTAKSPTKKKSEELEKRRKNLQERQEKQLKECNEEYLKKFNVIKKNHYTSLKPLSPEKAEEFMKECTPLDPIGAEAKEEKTTSKKK